MTKRRQATRTLRLENSILRNGKAINLRPNLENGKLPRFTRNLLPPSNEEGHDENGCYQGYCNSATWCFALYFFQEQDLCNAIKLLYDSGKMNIRNTEELFRDSGIQIDADCVGFVSVAELMADYCGEQQLSEDQKTFDHYYAQLTGNPNNGNAEYLRIKNEWFKAGRPTDRDSIIHFINKRKA